MQLALERRHTKLAVVLCTSGKARLPFAQAKHLIQVRFGNDWFQLLPPILLLFVMTYALLAGCGAAVMRMLFLFAGVEAVTSVMMWAAGLMTSASKDNGNEGGWSMVSVVTCIEVFAAILWRLQATKASMLVVMAACIIWVSSVPYVKFVTAVMHCSFPEIFSCRHAFGRRTAFGKGACVDLATTGKHEKLD